MGINFLRLLPLISNGAAFSGRRFFHFPFSLFLNPYLFFKLPVPIGNGGLIPPLRV
jgi:hypothetical protein